MKLPTYRYIHYSYERFKQKLAGVEHNKKIAEADLRYAVEYEREKNALVFFINKTLRFEISLLEKDILDCGIDSIVKKHPAIKGIIQNIEVIKKEIELWTN